MIPTAPTDVDLTPCVWRKSTYSANSQGDCVEVADPGPIAVRDSKNPTAGTLAVPRPTWTAFITAVRRSTL